jgi:hypothetical protein
VAPIAIDPAQVGQALARAPGGVAAVRAALEVESGDLSWERHFFAALDTPGDDERSGLVNEQLLDLEWRASRWARVPRVCASISTSSGFLFATMALIGGLSEAPLPDVSAAVSPALDALSVSIAGAAFCIAVHVRVRRAVRQWLSAVDRLVTSTRPAVARVM